MPRTECRSGGTTSSRSIFLTRGGGGGARREGRRQGGSPRSHSVQRGPAPFRYGAEPLSALRHRRRVQPLVPVSPPGQVADHGIVVQSASGNGGVEREQTVAEAFRSPAQDLGQVV